MTPQFSAYIGMKKNNDNIISKKLRKTVAQYQRRLRSLVFCLFFRPTFVKSKASSHVQFLT